MNGMLKKALFLVLLVLAILILLGGSLFLYEEMSRNRLLKSYEPSKEMIENIRSKGGGRIERLMDSKEVLACALGGYGSAGDLLELNDAQRNATPKSILPSEDGAWYLIFFSTLRPERIYLIGQGGERGLVYEDFGCFKPGDFYEADRVDQPDGSKEWKLLFRKGIEK
jgi:hypothetical protein